MTNPNAAANLTKKGADANPNGRPKKEWTWAGLLKEKLEENPNGDMRTYKELVAESLRDLAIKGDVAAIKEFGNRIDGLPPQTIKQSGDITLNVRPIMAGSAKLVDELPTNESLPETTQTE